MTRAVASLSNAALGINSPMADSADAVVAVAVRASTTKPRRKKIHTYNKRSAEMVELRSERTELELRLRFYMKLKRRRLREIEALREQLRVQGVLLASAMSVISAMMCQQEASPVARSIRLGRDLAKRRSTIVNMRPLVIQDATEFYHEHRQLLDPTAFMSQDRRFQARNGDSCIVRLEVIPLARSTTVKKAFDVLQRYATTMEISATEALGDLTLRENWDETDDCQATQNRFVASLADTVVMDMNAIIFAEYTAESDIGVIVSHYVDEDELFPYQYDSRVRHDFTIVDVVAKYPAPDDDGDVVSITRWGYTRVHQPVLFAVVPNLGDRIMNSSAQVDQHMWNTVRHACE